METVSIDKEEVVQNEMHEANDVERNTTLSRFDDDVEQKFVRSVADSLLMQDGEHVFAIAFGITVLQLLISLMVAVSELRQGVGGNPRGVNIVTYLGATFAIVSSVNDSVREFWINNECLELMKKATPGDKLIGRKDIVITLYYVSQLALVFATVVSLAQQPTPVGIITNCTGLILIQTLDQGIFKCIQIPAKASHLMKQKLMIVKADPKFSSKRMFLLSCALMYTIIIICAYKI